MPPPDGGLHGAAGQRGRMTTLSPGLQPSYRHVANSAGETIATSF